MFLPKNHSLTQARVWDGGKLYGIWVSGGKRRRNHCSGAKSKHSESVTRNLQTFGFRDKKSANIGFFEKKSEKVSPGGISRFG